MYMMLVVIIAGLAWQNISQKIYNEKVGGGACTFATICAFVAALFFGGLSIGTFSFNSGFILYSILFGVAYSVSFVFMFLAIREGSLALTSLVVSYSLILPTLYGLIFLNEKIRESLIVGLVLLVTSLFFINAEKGQTRQVTAKWGVYAFLSFLGNGGCTIIQRLQQIQFSGNYKNEFMMIALLMSAVVLMIFATVFVKESVFSNFRKGGIYGVLCGIANAVVNLLVMILSNRMPISVMFPIVSAGGIVVSFFVSRFLYKETLNKMQYIGFSLGILSIIFLNI